MIAEMPFDTSLEKRLERLADAEQKSLDEVVASLLRDALDNRESGIDPWRFFSAFLHEIRTPLASLMMVSELLEDFPSVRGVAKAERYVSMLNVTLGETSQLVSQVGELVRGMSRSAPPAPQPLPLEEMLENLNSTYREARSMGDPSLEIRLASEAPKGACVDQTQAPRILQDLIDWVVGSTSADVVFLEVASEELEGENVLVVRLGPVASSTETWFRPFETKSLRRRDGSQRQTGLELLSARVRARSLGGNLEAEEDDLGSQLILRLPLLHRNVQEPAAGPESSPTI